MKMPKMGESVAEATIIRWLKNVGDPIESDEPVLEIATDKVDSEVPAPGSGILMDQLFKEGDVVKVGAVIAHIGSSVGEKVATPVSTPTPTSIPTPAAMSIPNAPQVAPVLTQSISTPVISGNGTRFYSPLVRNIANKENISETELETISGTGAEGRVTKRDILKYVNDRAQGIAPAAAKVSSVSTQGSETMQAVKNESAATKPAVSVDGDVDIIEMDRMRKLIAEHMVMSKHTSPHVTSFVEADVTNMVLWRNKVKKEFEKREGEKLTFTPLFIEAVARSIKDFPLVNISVDGTKILIKKNINIGMATALPNGNLIVPVIRNADRMNLIGLAKSVNDLAARARTNKLSPDEIQGGTFTISNVGNFGNVMGTPIINQPQVAILAVGAIRKKPAVIETDYGDTIGIRHMMFLSLSYDHRVVDGSLGGSFVKRIAEYLEQFDVHRSI